MPWTRSGATARCGVVILGGAGGAFCAGGDIGTMDADPSAEHARERMVRLLFTVEA